MTSTYFDKDPRHPHVRKWAAWEVPSFPQEVLPTLLMSETPEDFVATSKIWAKYFFNGCLHATTMLPGGRRHVPQGVTYDGGHLHDIIGLACNGMGTCDLCSQPPLGINKNLPLRHLKLVLKEAEHDVVKTMRSEMFRCGSNVLTFETDFDGSSPASLVPRTNKVTVVGPKCLRKYAIRLVDEFVDAVKDIAPVISCKGHPVDGTRLVAADVDGGGSTIIVAAPLLPLSSLSLFNFCGCGCVFFDFCGCAFTYCFVVLCSISFSILEVLLCVKYLFYICFNMKLYVIRKCIDLCIVEFVVELSSGCVFFDFCGCGFTYCFVVLCSCVLCVQYLFYIFILK